MKRTARLIGMATGLVALVAVSAASAQDFFYDVEIPEAAQALTLGEGVTGELTEDAPIQAYSVDLVADQILNINVDFDEFDGYLLVANADGDVIAYNDDGAGVNNSNLAAFQVEEDGVYTIAVSTYRYVTSEGDDATVEGEYTLTATAVEVAALTLDEGVEGELTDDVPSALYSLDLEPGQIATLTVEADEFDVSVTTTSVEDAYATEYTADSYGRDGVVRITPSVYTGGTLLVTVASYFGDVGDYTLTASLVQPTPLTVGEVVRGELTVDDPVAFFQVDGIDDEQLSLFVRATENFDLLLEVYDPGGELVAENDDFLDRNPVLPLFEPEEDGLYTIVVRSVNTYPDENDLGEFDILLGQEGDTLPGENV